MWRIQRRLGARLGNYDVLYVRGHPLAYLISRIAKKRTYR